MPTATAAEGWEKWDDWNRRVMGPAFDWLLRAVAPAPGHAVLDVACGAGQPALQLAARVAPGGRVVAVDVSPEMVAAARRRAAAAGLATLEAVEGNAEDLRFPDGVFDGATCAFGLMFCDATRALAELRRVLRPGGRVAVAVWHERERNPFFTTMLGPVLDALGAPAPDPRTGMFRFGPGPALAGAFADAGFADARIDEVPLSVDLDSIDQHWEMASDMAGPVRAAATTLPPDALARLRARLAESLAPYVVEGGALRLPASALCAVATRS